ncbi:MAG: hypothetical protein GQ570_09755 [Helicobacteraceae bacterium]|nr:hypothetical protein [Helicobacteraceae bacterium]
MSGNIVNSDEFYETFLPFSKRLSSEYNGDKDTESLMRVMYEFCINYSDIKTPQECFSIEEDPSFPLTQLGSNLITYRLIEFLTTIKNPNNVLEIGTFIGCSTMYIASKLSQNSKIVSLEKYDRFYNIAKRNISANNLTHKVELKNIDALEYLKDYNGEKFDMVFLDGNKENYKDYLILLENIMNSGCLIVIDNTSFSCDTLNEVPNTEKGLGVKSMLEYTKKLSYLKIVLPLSDGIMLMIANNKG